MNAVMGAVLRVLTHRAFAWTVVFAVGLAALQGAEARVGGGQGFSSGSGGGYSSGGGGGGDGDLLIDIFILLLHLCIEYPAVGIPLMLVFIAGVGIRVMFFSGDRPHYENRRIGVEAPAPTRRRGRGPARGLDSLVAADPAFSVPVFLDFAGLVHRRALEASTAGNFDVLAPFATEDVRNNLVNQLGRRKISEVVIGGTRLVKVAVQGDDHRAEVEFDANYTLEDGKRLYVVTRWAWRRAGGAVSLAPDETMALGCPNCGNPVETTPLGACTTCDSPITKGQLQWQATHAEVLSSKPVKPPKLGLLSGGEEPSVSIPTVVQPDFVGRLRRFVGRHPDFKKKAFKQRVNDVYFALQTAWSNNRWEEARPFVTDPLYQQLRFWMEDYKRNQLRNRLEDIQLHTVRIVAVDDDAWYESITVRIYGSMKDSTIDAEGTVVAGNAKKDRKFSEYWTFLRAAGSGADSKPADACPSCGAPLDRIGSSGVCGYCDSKITSGQFDWVLSRIDQAEVYRG